MRRCHKIYPNCIWHVPPERHGLNSALLSKVYLNYTTHIVSICVSSKSPINPQLHVNKKSNLQAHFGSKAMASLYELICHHSLTNEDPLREEFLCYLPTRFALHNFDCIAYESTDNESVRSITSSVSAFYSEDSTSFS